MGRSALASRSGRVIEWVGRPRVPPSDAIARGGGALRYPDGIAVELQRVRISWRGGNAVVNWTVCSSMMPG